MAHAQREASGRLAVVLCAAAMLALLVWQVAPYREEERAGTPVSLASLAQRGHAELGAALRLKQRQQLELREEEKDWGARIQALAGKPTPGAARLQELGQLEAPGSNFAAFMRAARMQTLTETEKKTASSSFNARISTVEIKYHEMLAQKRKDTALKEREVQKLFSEEMKKLADEGHKQDARLRMDEENAETTILAEKKEAEIKKQLQAVRQAAELKARKLQAQLDAAHTLALKYTEEVQKLKLPSSVHFNLPAGLAKEVGETKDLDTKNNTALLGKIESSFEHSLDQINGDKDAENDKEAAELAKAAKDKADAARKAKLERLEAKQEAEEKDAKAKLAKRKAAEAKAAAAAKAAKEKEEKERAAAAAKEAAELAAAAAAKKKKEEEVRCTEVSCPLGEMDKATVVDGSSIHNMEKEVEQGHGMAKSQALAMITKLQSQIQDDFKKVTGFATYQEHVLDAKKVAHDTASMLGRETALSLMNQNVHGIHACMHACRPCTYSNIPACTHAHMHPLHKPPFFLPA